MTVNPDPVAPSFFSGVISGDGGYLRTASTAASGGTTIFTANNGYITGSDPTGALAVYKNNPIVFTQEINVTNAFYVNQLNGEGKVLWKMPVALIKAYPKKIINIHPALLPKFGGRGMYGNKVHETVIAENEKESGITIHYVNEVYDEGETIFQVTCDVDKTDTPETLTQKIHLLEHTHFPEVVEKLVLSS